MKAHFKTFLLVGFGGLATVLGVATLPQAAVSNHSNASMEVVQVATEPLSHSEIQIAQAPKANGLAAELQGKPTVVKIYADWCSACQRLRPVTNSLQQQFNGKANFVVFDVTNRTTTQAAEAKARQLGLSNFLSAHRAQTSTIAVINPSNGQILRQFRYNFNQQEYVSAINQAIARISARS